MKIVHQINERRVSKDILPPSEDAENLGFLITNRKGGFFLQGAKGNFSRYCGSYFSAEDDSGWKLYKTIEEIRLPGFEPDTITNEFSDIERKTGVIAERFFMDGNTIFYEIENHKGFFELVLDCREMYDINDIGRVYTMSKERDIIIIEYTKYKDADLKLPLYSLYVSVVGAEAYVDNNAWEKRRYLFDKKRGTYPYEAYVYNAIKIDVAGNSAFAISSAGTREEAIKLARRAKENYWQRRASIKAYKQKVITGLGRDIRYPDEKTEFALMCAVNSVDSLINFIGRKEGIYAGLPWFHQFWTRDETITVRSVMLENRHAEAKRILLGALHMMLPDGRLSNRHPISELSSADSVGWAFKRMDELITAFEEMKVPPGIITADDVVFVKNRLRYAIEQILSHRTEEGLVNAGELESWMDTSYKDDIRQGFLIEIQALQLEMYKLMQFLCTITKNMRKYEAYKALEEATREKVRLDFWKDPALCDRKGDMTIRPNIFIAYYIYPGILSKDEWIRCFDHALEKLWLPWGGLSTIDRMHPLFSERYTGEDNKSYHRGDSWFLINNIAAICMHRLDHEKYKEQITKILDASTEDILFKGIIGHASELSSAEKQRAEASLCQAWSAGTYIELVHEIYGKK